MFVEVAQFLSPSILQSLAEVVERILVEDTGGVDETRFHLLDDGAKVLLPGS